jgi:hypothetical protein
MKEQTQRTQKQKIGDDGEKEIAKHVPCPNCGKKLETLPKNYPLYDVQCNGCYFRAQVKTSGSSAKSTVRGAGWGIINKVMKAGFLAPPLIVYFRGTKLKGKKNHKTKSQILFFPFVTKKTMVNHTLNRPDRYKMFNYDGLLNLPHFELVKKGARKIWETGLPKTKKTKSVMKEL